MVAITISTNFPSVQRRLDALRDDIVAKALPSAINRTMAQGQSEMTRQITAEFNIRAGKVREKLFLKRASFKQGRLLVEAVLTSRDKSGRRRSINLINFGGRQTKAGFAFKIKKGGGKGIIKSGFIGNKGRTAFRRIGKDRLPITPLQTIDVPQMFNTKRINAAVVKKITAIFPSLLERDIAFYTGKFNASRG